MPPGLLLSFPPSTCFNPLEGSVGTAEAHPGGTLLAPHDLVLCSLISPARDNVPVSGLRETGRRNPVPPILQGVKAVGLSPERSWFIAIGLPLVDTMVGEHAPSTCAADSHQWRCAQHDVGHTLSPLMPQISCGSCRST